MFQLVHVTALYSNAVLVAILPYFTDVAKKMDLPIVTPITQAQVHHFFCDPRAGEVGGWVTLTDGYQFWFEKGHVRKFESPHSYFSLQDPDQIPKFRGKPRMTTNEAVFFAVRQLYLAGYDTSFILTSKLKITLAPKDKGFDIPHYEIEWIEPNQPDNRIAAVEVNADAKRIERFTLFGKQFSLKNPEIGIKPEPLPKSKPQYMGGNQLIPVSASYSNAFIKAVLPQITDYARKLNLPLKLPIESMQFQNVEIGLLNEETELQIILTNGYRFNYGNGYVHAFYAPDCFFTYDWKQTGLMKYEDFIGPLTVPENELISVARKAIQRLGYSEKILQMESKPLPVGGPGKGATNGITRYFYEWRSLPFREGTPIVAAEIDARTKTLKSLYLKNTNLWREPPKITVSPEIEK